MSFPLKDETIELRRSPDCIGVRKEGEAEKASKKIEGHVALFNTRSALIWGFYEKILPGAFADSIGQDDIRALVDHDPSKVLGRNKSGTLELKEDERGLFAVINPPDTTVARDLLTSIERGDITGASFGFRVLDDSWEHEDGDDIHILRKASLFDVSVVTYPAYPDTKVGLRMLTSMEKIKNDRLVVCRMKLRLAEV